MISHEIEKYVSKFKAKSNNDRSPSKLKTNFRFDPIPYKWTLYKHGKILTYGYCHSQKQAEEIITRELQEKS